jgi:hypothetical protein
VSFAHSVFGLSFIGRGSVDIWSHLSSNFSKSLDVYTTFMKHTDMATFCKCGDDGGQLEAILPPEYEIVND